ncbi:MAG TPA: glycosyltransferase [Gemmatimonadales bacterium]|nr:glycosyltransferase [Gemmatimonadales bacterium]
MKVALVHDYLYQYGGAERVLAALHRLFPDAPVYTTIADPELVASLLPTAEIRTSWMQRLPALRRHHRKYFMFYPSAVEQWDLSAFDLVVSNSSAFGKGVRTRPDACHVCYCHTPMRFGWEFARYAAREEWRAPTRLLLRPLVEHVRRWDVRTARRPTGYLANSTAGARKIARCYGANAAVVHPPVEVDRFCPAPTTDDFHLVVARLVGYKRVDLAVEAFNRLGRPLVVIGDGPARASLERIAAPHIRFLGRVSDAEVARHYARCRALIIPGEEDFGLTPLEANAAGRPAIAFGAGGALDTVQHGVTGMLFPEQTTAALAAAVTASDAIAWNTDRLRSHAGGFSEARFRERMTGAIDAVLSRVRPLSA